MTVQIKSRRDTAANWTANNPTLALGEIGVEIDAAAPATAAKIKVGNGVTAWNSLPYASAAGVTDHGLLTGLADDDHTQYHNDARGDARYTQKANNLSDVANAATARTNLGLGGAATLNVGTLAGTVAAGDDARITGAAQKSANLSDLGSAATARTNLGLGTSATLNVPAVGDAAAGEVVKGSDTRLTDARTPSAHASTHSSAGSDPISHDNLAGLTTGDPHTQYINNTRGDARYLRQTFNLADVLSPSSARANLGLGTAAEKNIPATGNAAATEVVFGTDTRLTDSRTPTAHASTHAAGGSDALTVTTDMVQANAVTNAKLAQVATQTIKGRNTAATGDVEDLTTATVAGMLAVGGDLTGTVANAQIAAGAVGTTELAANNVTNAKLAQVATATFKGRTTAGTGDVEDLSATQATALLNVFTGALKGLVPSGGTASTFLRGDATWQTISGGGDMLAANNLSDLTNVATARTNLGLGSLATLSAVGSAQITDGSVANADLANMNSATIKGRVTAGAGAPEDLTGTQATTLLDVFTSSLKGLVPASGGGTANFLRADGTWAAPLSPQISNSSVAQQVFAAGTETYVTGSQLAFGGRQKQGTIAKWRIYLTKTAAGTATWSVTVRVGTAGTIADGNRVLFNVATQTAATDRGWLDVEMVFRSINATTGVIYAICQFTHTNPPTGTNTSTGFQNVAAIFVNGGASANFDTTSNPLYAGISITPGASAVFTIEHCSAEASNLS